MTTEEVSFARFVVSAYLFCSQQIADLIYDFLSLLRQRYNLRLHAIMFMFTLMEVLKVLVEDTEKTHTLKFVMDLLSSRGKDDEISAISVIKLGLKFPIIFYPLERFRKHFKRLVFGDQFWELRKNLKSNLADLPVASDEYKLWFINEEVALAETAIAIISDIESDATISKYKYNENFPRRSTTIDEELCLDLVRILGYKTAWNLITDSKLPIVCDPIFLQAHLPNHKKDKVELESFFIPEDSVVLYDEKAGRKFKFSALDGSSTWAQHVVSPAGEIVRENFT